MNVEKSEVIEILVICMLLALAFASIYTTNKKIYILLSARPL